MSPALAVSPPFKGMAPPSYGYSEGSTLCSMSLIVESRVPSLLGFSSRDYGLKESGEWTKILHISALSPPPR